LHIARGLINDPEVLFLDEPTIGLDPVAAFELRQVIKGVVKEGKTVFLTTHYMKEAEELCDRIAIINDGQIVALDTPSNLKQYARLVPVIEFAVEGMSERHLAKIRAIPEVQAATLDDVGMSQVLKVQSSRGSELIQPLMALLPDVRFGGVKVREPTLEDAYIQLVGGKA
jgi:ABC-2 type transport system ATP-binding protein